MSQASLRFRLLQPGNDPLVCRPKQVAAGRHPLRNTLKIR